MIEVTRYILASIVAQTHLMALGIVLARHYRGVRFLHVKRVPDDEGSQ